MKSEFSAQWLDHETKIAWSEGYGNNLVVSVQFKHYYILSSEETIIEEKYGQ